MRADLGRARPLDELARSARLSPFHFHRVFREITAVTPARFLAALRIAEARRLLVYTTMTVGEVSWRVGYESLGTFTTLFGALLGVSPARFRRLMRALYDKPVAALLPAIRAADSVLRGPPVNLLGRFRSTDLVISGLSPAGSLPKCPGAWTVTAGAGPVRLPGLPASGECAAYSVVVAGETKVADAFVDEVPGSYLQGGTRLRLPVRTGAEAYIPLRSPGPTDPPLLAVTSLRWLAMGHASLIAS